MLSMHSLSDGYVEHASYLFLLVMSKVCSIILTWSALCLLRLCYVQSLTGHKSPVTAVSASETTGDIATVCDSGDASLCLPLLGKCFFFLFLGPQFD